VALTLRGLREAKAVNYGPRVMRAQNFRVSRKMRKFAGSAILIASIAAVGFAVPAKADILYDLNFENSSNVSIGTGVLDLNLSSLSQAYNLTSFSSFKSLTTTSLDGQVIDITPTNLAGGSIDTGSVGQIYSLTIQEDEPPTDANGTANILFLDIYTNDWQLHGTYNDTPYSGPLLVSSPQDPPARVPEPLTLSLFGTGLAGVAAIRRRRKPKQV
jgi:hypothetical protein